MKDALGKGRALGVAKGRSSGMGPPQDSQLSLSQESTGKVGNNPKGVDDTGILLPGKWKSIGTRGRGRVDSRTF